MKCKILQAFDYGHEGTKVVRLVVGKLEEIRDELVDGLEAAGLVARPKAEKAAPAAPPAPPPPAPSEPPAPAPAKKAAPAPAPPPPAPPETPPAA